MYQEEMKSSELAKFLSNFDYVFVDTCSLMEDSFPAFMDVLARSKEYWKEGLRVVILGECIQELKRHAQNKKDSGVRIAARRALKIIRHDKWHNKTFEITKPLKKTSDFADNAIFTTVSGLRIENKILILTQDKTLTTDLLKLNRLDSQHGRYLEVYRLTQTATLEKNPGINGTHPFVKKHETTYPSGIVKDYRSGENYSRETPKTLAFSEAEKVIKAEDNRLSANLSNKTYADKKGGGKAERLQRGPCACLLLAACGKRLGTLRGTGAQGIRTRRRYRRKSWGEMACCRSSMVRTKASGAP